MACLAGLFGLWLWFDATFGQDPPLRVRTAASDFEPWPAEIDVIDSRLVMGGPQVSVATAPDVERLYVVVDATDRSRSPEADAVTGHLSDRGWSISSPRSESAWYEYWATGPSGEMAYIGPLDAYLDSGGWVREDLGAGPQLRDAAGDRLSSAIVVQVFARE